MFKFFRSINLYIGIYFADILVLNAWDNLTNILNSDIETLIFWGQRAKKYAERLNKK